MLPITAPYIHHNKQPYCVPYALAALLGHTYPAVVQSCMEGRQVIRTDKIAMVLQRAKLKIEAVREARVFENLADLSLEIRVPVFGTVMVRHENYVAHAFLLLGGRYLDNHTRSWVDNYRDMPTFMAPDLPVVNAYSILERF